MRVQHSVLGVAASSVRDCLSLRDACVYMWPPDPDPLRPHPPDSTHSGHMDDAVVLRDAARDAALFEGTPPALGSPSTEVSGDRGEVAEGGKRESVRTS